MSTPPHQLPYFGIHHKYNDYPHQPPVTPEDDALTFEKYSLEQYTLYKEAHRHNMVALTIFYSIFYTILYPFLRSAHLHYVRQDVNFVNPTINYRVFAWRYITKQEGVRHLWRGLLPSMTFWFLTLWLEKTAGALTWTPLESRRDQVEGLFRAVAAATFVTTGQALAHPLRMAALKVATDTRPKGIQAYYKYTTSADALLRVYRFNGLPGLYRGVAMTYIRNYVCCVSTFFGAGRQQSRDEGVDSNSWLTYYFHPFRYDFLTAWIYTALTPLETIRARMMYRVPTYSTDIAPQRFPHMWMPTFRGFLGMYRGSLSGFIHAFCLSTFTSFIYNQYEDYAHNPPGQRRADKELLLTARHAGYARHIDEAAQLIPQYPRFGPNGPTVHGVSRRMEDNVPFPFNLPHAIPRSIQPEVFLLADTTLPLTSNDIGNPERVDGDALDRYFEED